MMQTKKLSTKLSTTLIMVMLFLSPFIAVIPMASANSLTVNLSTPETGTHSYIEVSGDVEWTTDGVKLYVLDGSTDWAEISIPVDMALGEISELSFWEYVESYDPKGAGLQVILGIDLDKDGVFESDLPAWHQGHGDAHTLEVLHGDAFAEMDAHFWKDPPIGAWMDRDALTEGFWWAPNELGTGFCSYWGDFSGFSEFLDGESNDAIIPNSDARVLCIKLLIGGSGSWMDETAYVRSLTYSASPGVTIDLLPSGNVGDTVTVTGSGASPGGLMKFYWDQIHDWDGLKGYMDETYALGDGTFECELTIPEVPGGSHWVIVKDMEGAVVASAPFTLEPEITLSAEIGLSGDSVDVAGTGYDADMNVTILFDGTNVTPETVYTDDLGSFASSFVVPNVADAWYYVNAGNETLGIWAGKDFHVSKYVIITPEEGYAGDTVSFSGRVYPNEYVNVTFNGEIMVGLLLTTGNGSFSGSFMVPWSYGHDPGFKVVKVVNATDVSDVWASADFELLEHDPEISVVPDECLPGETVHVDGSFFSYEDEVNVTIGLNGETWDDITQTSEINGTFSADITIPADTPIGLYWLWAEDDTYYAEVSFVVIGLSVTPNKGLYWETVEIRGAGFTPYNTTVITWDELGHWQEFVPADPDGMFTTWVNVPDGLSAGAHTITATDEQGITRTATFTLYYVDVEPWGTPTEGWNIYIDTPETYSNLYAYNYTWYNGFRHNVWTFEHDSYDFWYSLLSKGIQALVVEYDGTTYVWDLDDGSYNSYPDPLIQRVTGFEVVSPTQIRGTIVLNATSEVQLLTIQVDIYVPETAKDYYSMVFTLKADADLDYLAFYNAYDLNVCTPDPNWAYYSSDLDAVYQMFDGPYVNLPKSQAGYAGFASVLPASTHHDAVINYNYVQDIDDELRDYDYNYRNRNKALWGDCGVGLQWTAGILGEGSEFVVPIVYAASESLEGFKSDITAAKFWAYRLVYGSESISLTPGTGSGLSIMTVSGTEFMPLTTVDVYFEGVYTASFSVNSAGSFTGNFVVPVTAEGTYTVRAVDAFGLEDSASYQVVDLYMTEFQDLKDRLDALGLTLEDVNATLSGLITDTEGNLALLIETRIGTVLASLDDVNASISSLIVDAKGEVLLEIQTDLGVVTARFDDVDSALAALDIKVVDFAEDVDGYYLLLNTTLGELEIKLDAIPGLITGAKAAVITDIDGKYLLINTVLGELEVKLDAINATLVSIEGEVATIKTDVGTVKVDVAAIKPVVTSINGTVATIRTDVGTIKGQVLSVVGDVATIKTDVGTVKLDVSALKTSVTGTKTAVDATKAAVDGMTTLIYAAIVLSLIAALAAAFSVIQVSRKIAG